MFCSGEKGLLGSGGGVGGWLPTTLKLLSTTSLSDTNTHTYLRLAVMSLKAGTLWKLKWRG